MRRWVAVLLLLGAAGLRLWDLGGQSLWYDEAYSWHLATQMSLAESVDSSLREFIPPLAYVLWRGWAAMAGTSELAMRAISALLGVVAVAAVGRLSYRLTQRGGGFLAGLGLAAIAPPMLWAARELRMYGPLLTFTLLADVALLEVLRGNPRHRRAWGWVWGLTVLASLYTVVLAGFWLLGLGVFALVAVLLDADTARRRATVRALWLPTLLAGLLYLPWLVPALGRLGENAGYWPGTLTAETFFGRAVQGITVFRFIAPELTARRLGAGIAALALVAPVLAVPLRALPRRLTQRGGGAAPQVLMTPILLLPSRSRSNPLAPLFPLSTGVLPLLVMSLVFRRIPKWELQHTVIFAPAVVLALAASGDALFGPLPRRRRWLRRLGVMVLGAALGLIVLVFLMADKNMLANPAYGHDDWRGAAGYVEANREPGDVVILEAGCVAPAWRYYGSDEGLLPLPDDPLLNVTRILHYENTAQELNSALADAPAVWVVGWLDHVVDPTDIVGTLLEEVGEPNDVPAFRGLKVRHYTLTEAPAFPPTPPTTTRPGLELLPALTLWGVTLPEEELPADYPLSIRTWWTTSNPAAHEGKVYQASLRLYDARGDLWAQHDAPPGGGDYRPERWPVETPILGRFDVPLLPGTPAGPYTATLLLYEIGGPRFAEVAVGSVTLERPTAPPPLPEDMAAVTREFGDAPLALLGARLNATAVEPCEALKGWLFWELTDALETPYRMRVSLGAEAVDFAPPVDLTGSAWQPGDRFLTQFRLPISCRALDTTGSLRIALVAPAPELGAHTAALVQWAGPEAEIVAHRAFEPPREMTPARVVFGDGFATLLGYRLEPGEPGEQVPFRVVLYWRADALTDAAYTAFVHATPPDAPGPVVEQHDGWPGLGEKPTYGWAFGEVVTDPHPLDGLPAGRYGLRVGLYASDGTRLPAVSDEVPVVDDAAVIATLAVE